MIAIELIDSFPSDVSKQTARSTNMHPSTIIGALILLISNQFWSLGSVNGLMVSDRQLAISSYTELYRRGLADVRGVIEEINRSLRQDGLQNRDRTQG